MNKLDFPGLRNYVESQTYLPEFTEVERRARRHKRRRRATTVATTLGGLLIVLPAFVFGTALLAGPDSGPAHAVIGLAGVGRPNDVGPGGGPAAGPIGVPTGGPVPVIRNLVAADGIDASHLFGLVDVCVGKNCNLQLVTITPDSRVLRIGLLRSDPAQALLDPRLVVLDATTVVVSAGVGGAASVQSVTATVAPTASAPATTMDRPVQVSSQGPIMVVRARHHALSTILNQPSLSQPTLTAATHGWWVTGTDPTSGEAAVSVSRDEGRTWLTRSIGVLADVPTAALTTSDGTHVYLALRSAGQMLFVRSTDGGHTWATPVVMPGWPITEQFGLYVRHNGEVVVWLITNAGATYLSSNDGGTTFTPAIGPVVPSGGVVTLKDGYITLGQRPSISTNGVTWTTPYLPYLDVAN